MIVAGGLSQKEAAKRVGVHETTVSKWKRDSDYEELKKKAEREFLSDLAAPALRTMESLLYAKSDYVRYQAASDILDRTGHKSPDKSELMGDLKLEIKVDYGPDNSE